VWDPTRTVWSINVSTKTSDFIVTYPRTTTPLDIVNPVSRTFSSKTMSGTFGCNQTLLAQLFSVYQLSFPELLGPDRWVSSREEKLGDVGIMTSNLTTTQVSTPSVQFTTEKFSDNQIYTVLSAGSQVCVNYQTIIDTAVYSFNAELPTTSKCPLYIEFSNDMISPLYRVQVSLNSSNTSQYQQFLLANSQGSGSVLDASNRLLDLSLDSYSSDLVNITNPSYTALAEFVGQSVAAADQALFNGLLVWSRLKTVEIAASTLRSSVITPLWMKFYQFFTMNSQRPIHPRTEL
jgi:hypothetical protein